MARRRVITERDIAQALRTGSRALDIAGAVVTPSARDAAKRVGVELRAGVTEERDAAAGSGSATSRTAGHHPAKASTSPASTTPERATPPTSERAAAPLRIALGADHGGVTLKETIAARLRELGHDVDDVGTVGAEPVDYPDFAVAVARRVADRRADFGIMIDGAGIGSCMAANKVPGARAAMCYDVTTAQNAREHNGATVLTLGAGLIGTRLALAIVESFLGTPFGGGRHASRVAKIDALDRSG